MNMSAWNYVFLNKPYTEDCIVSEEKLKIMRDEFRYWYPMDLRCSGKDLMKNHLTMSLFNHASIWEDEPEMMPKSFFCNGWVNVDG
jgi:leucyl-tRNA synthetase